MHLEWWQEYVISLEKRNLLSRFQAVYNCSVTVVLHNSFLDSCDYKWKQI